MLTVKHSKYIAIVKPRLTIRHRRLQLQTAIRTYQPGVEREIAIKRIAYLAGSSSTQSEYGQTSEITPGEVTTGFAMTIIPHILDRRRVLLQYSINLSSLDELTEFSTQDLTVQLPKTSTRAFSQRSQMQMGQTLVLAGFQDQTQQLATSLGLLNFGRGRQYAKTLLVITIELEAAGGGTED